jgi:hypothetical protein
VSLIGLLIAACATDDLPNGSDTVSGAVSDSPTTVPTPTAVSPTAELVAIAEPTSTPFLVPYTPTPVVEIEPIDPAVLEIIGAGKRKQFPIELMDGSPELPEEEVIRLWTEFQSNSYIVQSPSYILYTCEGGMFGAASVIASPMQETLGANFEVIGPTSFPKKPWNHARFVLTDLFNGRQLGNLQPPQSDGRFEFTSDATGQPSRRDYYEKNDCPDYSGRDLEPTPMPLLPVSEPGNQREISAELLNGDESIDAWTAFLTNTHIAPVGVTSLGKIELENDNPVLSAYMLKRHHLNGNYDLLLCGDGRYHWMGTAPVNVNDFEKAGWRHGQDGDWEVRLTEKGLVLQLLADDPRVILKGAAFPLQIMDGEFQSTMIPYDRSTFDLVFNAYEATGCS